MKNIRRPVNSISHFALLGSLLASLPAFADPPAAPASSQLEVITVTAEKRTENIKDVPYSISAISGAALQERHIENYEDIARTVPGLSFGAGGSPGQDVITLRGVSSQGGNATVGLYMDDIPIVTQTSYAPPAPTSGAAEPKVFDLGRVEVLRGPQGTLYGAGSMGGAIRFITRTPDLDNLTATATGDFSGTEHGGFNYDDSAVLNIPITPGVAAIRFGIDSSQDSGYIDHYAPVPLTETQVLNNDYNHPKGAETQSGVNTDRTLAGRLTGE